MYHVITSIFTILMCSIIISSCKEQNKKVSTQDSTTDLRTNPIETSITEITTQTPNRIPVFAQYHSNLDGMVSEFVRKMFQDKSGNYWFGTNGDGVIRYNGVSLDKFSTVASPSKRYVVSFGTCRSNIPFGPSKLIS